ncbi:mitochondrial carrier domain-containing protein [Blyttiomyces helicus]|uniref:Mitochondrial carrier domain-containing protein n=1 Tax=Blyttiomyces helicus TaxID=388810 RepID=A0A4P9WR53_9FUNG|nr:mitochondrial carrier domain-containing protein [Blyttiomyces helicus]|eukprot:RKO93710.1 mitochondrial carrier domain-containing protein [Blyttiomyces helicus]
MRTGYDENDPTRPPFMLPRLEGSALGVVGQLSSLNDEGFLSLWKGHTAKWLYDMSHLLLQPSIEGLFNDILGLSDEQIPLIHLDHPGASLATLVASHTVTGLFLSPLELVRTRYMILTLVAQTSNPFHKKYRGVFHCLRTSIAEEGLSAIYLGRNLIPTLLFHSITPFFKYSTDLIIVRLLGISFDDAPFRYSLCELALHTLELLITLPLETIRRRLQCQVVARIPGDLELSTVVERSPIPYAGIGNCAWRIVFEEGGSTSSAPPSWWSTWGFKGLYKGFRMRLVASIGLTSLQQIAEVMELEDSR